MNFARAKLASVLEKKQKKVSHVKDEAKIVKYLRAQVYFQSYRLYYMIYKFILHIVDNMVFFTKLRKAIS